MAERSTAAVGVAETSGEEDPLTARTGEAGADSATDGHSGGHSPADSRDGADVDSQDARRTQESEQERDIREAPESQEAPPGGQAEQPPAEPTAPGHDADAHDAHADAAPEPEPHGTPEPQEPPAPELHSGHKLARRYRLEECVTRLEGFSSWRAVDEKLRRAVGVHILPAGHPRARRVLSAARSSALLGDPRFVHVLDAVEEGDLVYVVHEWLPDAVPLSELLATGPLDPHEAYQLVTHLSQALAAAHREGLSHLRLTPSTVLRTGQGQYRVRGLAVNAALRGITSDTPQRDDTEAIGALLYAALTQRWPYEEDAYGLSGVGTLAKGTLVAPDQVRAGVHRGLSQLAMRALVNDGATASSEQQPCTTPEELAKAVAALPRIRPPEPAFTAPPPYQRTTYQQGGHRTGATTRQAPGGRPPAGEPPAPPTLPGRTGKALKWGVSALLIAALGLGSWQVADTLLKDDGTRAGDEPSASQAAGTTPGKPTGKPVKIVDAKDFDPPPAGNGTENSSDVPDAYDGDPTTYWLTQKYYGRPDFGNLKPGVGLILDLGKPQQVSKVKVDFMGETSAELRAAPRSASGMPTTLGGFRTIASGTGEHLGLRAKKPVMTQYVLVWLTKLPLSGDGDYRGRVTEIQVRS